MIFGDADIRKRISRILLPFWYSKVSFVAGTFFVMAGNIIVSECLFHWFGYVENTTVQIIFLENPKTDDIRI